MDETGQAHILDGIKIQPVDGTLCLPPKASLRAMWISTIVCECGHESLCLEAAEAHWRDAHPPRPPHPWWRFWGLRSGGSTVR